MRKVAILHREGDLPLALRLKDVLHGRIEGLDCSVCPLLADAKVFESLRKEGRVLVFPSQQDSHLSNQEFNALWDTANPDVRPAFRTEEKLMEMLDTIVDCIERKAKAKEEAACL